jgi:hypothetical protein
MTARKALTGLLIVAVVLAGAWLYREFKASEDQLEVLKQEDAKAQKTIQDIQKDKKALEIANQQIALDLAARDKKIADLDAKLTKAQAELEAALDHVSHATPTELLETLHLRIDAGIWLQKGAVEPEFVFSLAAGRKTAEVAEEWHSLKFVQVPDLTKKVEEQKGIIAGKDRTIENDKLMFADDAQTIGEKDKQIKLRDDALKAARKRQFKRDLVSGGVGAGVLAVLVLLFGK